LRKYKPPDEINMKSFERLPEYKGRTRKGPSKETRKRAWEWKKRRDERRRENEDHGTLQFFDSLKMGR